MSANAKTPSGPALPPGSASFNPLADTAIVVDGEVIEAAPAPTAVPSVSGDTLVGQVVGGRFRITRLIGKGGMGRVYEAVQESLGRKVAIKVIHSDLDLAETDYARFAEEARLTAQLDHPNIISIIEIGTLPDERYFYAMELLEGVTLAAEIESHPEPMSIARALHIVRQICGVMEVVHARGVIHRDLKPENIFLLRDSVNTDFVKILDFGLARLTDPTLTRRTVSGAGMGTPLYMSPEQVDSKETDGRTDIYALGAMLYEMLTGAAPYFCTSILEVLKRKATEAPASMRVVRPEIPEALDRVVLKALSRDREARYATMAEFHGALLTATGEVSASVQSAPLTAASQLRGGTASQAVRKSTRAERAAKAKRRFVIALAAFAAIVIVVATIALWPSSNGNNGQETVETEAPSPTIVQVPVFVPVSPQVVAPIQPQPSVAPASSVPVQTTVHESSPDASVPLHKPLKASPKTRKETTRRKAVAPPPSSLSGAPVQGENTPR